MIERCGNYELWITMYILTILKKNEKIKKQ